MQSRLRHTPCLCRPARALAVLLAVCCLGCVQDRIGRDRDGDGLTDRQERRFGTDPENPDTNANGIVDGRDPAPWVDTTPAILLAAGPAQAVGTEFFTPISIRLVRGRVVQVNAAADDLETTTNLGRLTPVALNGDGEYTTDLVTPTGGVATVIVSYSFAAEGDRPALPALVTNSIVVEVTGTEVLPQPGINPGPYAGAGPLAGALRVVTVQGDSTGWAGLDPAPFAGA